MSILSKLRYVICLPFIVVLGLVTAPLTLFFNWTGYAVLFIANREGCSLSKAKEILKSGNYQSFSNNDSIFHDAIEEFEDDERYSPSYKNLPSNIHHRNN